jgi:NADH-quinone oxidoreductase subunit G
LGEARPAWKVLRVLGNLLGLANFDYDSSEAIRDEVLDQQTDVSSRLSNTINLTVSNELLTQPQNYSKATFERIANIGIYDTDALARRAGALQHTFDAKPPQAWMGMSDALQMGVKEGDMVRVSQNGISILLPVGVDNKLPNAVVRVAAAHPSTAALSAMFGNLTVERA